MSATAPITETVFDAKYRVQRKGGGKARVKHVTFERAEAEAKRLLSHAPAATFYVLNEVARVHMAVAASQPAFTAAKAVRVRDDIRMALDQPEVEAKIDRLMEAALHAETDVVVAVEALMAAAAKAILVHYAADTAPRIFNEAVSFTVLSIEQNLDPDAATGCADDQAFADVPVKTLRDRADKLGDAA